MPVTVWLGLDSRTWDGELYGWAVDPSGAGGRMGLVHLVREFAPGFEQEYLRFAPAQHIERREA